MYGIKYDEHELLELFEMQPIPTYEAEVGMFTCRKKSKNDVELCLHFSALEETCSFSLNINNYTIFSASLVEVECLYGNIEEKTLKIC